MGDYGQYDVPPASTLVNFKVGQPAPSMLPLEKIRKAAALKFAESDPLFLQYGAIPGYPKFRATLSEFLTRRYKHDVDPERLFVTNGVTGGLSLILSLFCRSGDVVFMEEPSYFLALRIAQDFNLNVRQIPMDQDGLSISALEKILEAGNIPRLLYTIPTCHNPTGRTMSPEKRARLVELSVKYNFIIVADEVYQLLSFPQITPPPPFFTYDTHGTVLALGSFSKILAPSLRLGWIQGHQKLLKKIIDCGQLDSSGGINPVISGIVHSAISAGLQDEHLDWTKKILWDRAETLMNALKKYLPEGTTFEIPDGGYFILVRLPDGMQASQLLDVAAKHKVAYLPGSSFGENMKNYLRLSFSYYDKDDLAIGAERLAAAIKEFQSSQKRSESPNKTPAAPTGPKIAIHGASGRLGGSILQAVEAAPAEEAQLVGAIGRNDAIPEAANVVIDASLPEGTKALLKKLAGKKIPLVIGTTGVLPMDLIEDYSANAPVAISSNFSHGIPLMAHLAKEAINGIPEGWNIEIMEVHHTKKVDAPSGTAITLRKAVETTGAPITKNGVPISSLRLGDEFGTHSIFLAGPGERIELRHNVTRREVFGIGAVRIARWLVNQPPGIYYK